MKETAIIKNIAITVEIHNELGQVIRSEDIEWDVDDEDSSSSNLKLQNALEYIVDFIKLMKDKT